MDYHNIQFLGKQTRIRYIQEGEGPSILYLHGWSHSHRIWQEVLPYMTGYTNICLDWPGFGDSEIPANFDYSMESYAEILANFISSWNTSFHAIIAHSMGGLITIRYVQKFSATTHLPKIAICGSPLNGLPMVRRLSCIPCLIPFVLFLRAYSPDCLIRLGSTLTIARHNLKKFTSKLIQDVRRPSLQTVIKTLQHIASFSMTSFPKVHGKNLIIICGELEKILRRDVACTYANLFECDCITLPNMSHTYAIEEPCEFAQVLKNFIEKNV